MTTIQFRRGTASEWTSANPILAAGEAGYETDTGKFKIGNNSTAWNSLSYFQTGAGSSSNSFATISTPSGTSPVADSATDTLTLTAGTGITITGNSTTDTIEIASTITDTNTTYTLASGTNNGTLKLTPSSGSVQDNIAVTGLGTGAYATISNYAALSGATFTGQIQSTHASTWSSPAIIIGGAQGAMLLKDTDSSQADALIGANGGNFYILGDTASDGTYDKEAFRISLSTGDTTFLGSLSITAPSTEFPVNFTIPATSHVTSERAAINLGAWQIGQDTAGNGTTNFYLYGNAANVVVIDTSSNTALSGDLAVNGGDLTTSVTGTASLFNTNATTLNIGGAATTISMGAGTGNVNFNDNISAEGYITARRASNQDSVRLLGRAGGSSNYDAILTPTTLTDNRTITIPNASGTMALIEPTEIGNAINLNDLTTNGTYTQSSNAEAAAGTNYPEAIAGTLTVVANAGAGQIYQTYHTLAGASDATNRMYHRGKYDSVWSPWSIVSSPLMYMHNADQGAVTITPGGGSTVSAFGTNGINLDVGAYEVEAVLYITNAATGTSGTPGTLIITPGSPSGAAVPSSSQLYYTYAANTTVLSNASAVSGVRRSGTTTFPALNTITIAAGSTTYTRIFLKAIVRIATAGNFTLRLAYTGATSGNYTSVVNGGSYLKITPLGSEATTEIGTWA